MGRRMKILSAILVASVALAASGSRVRFSADAKAILKSAKTIARQRERCYETLSLCQQVLSMKSGALSELKKAGFKPTD